MWIFFFILACCFFLVNYKDVTLKTEQGTFMQIWRNHWYDLLCFLKLCIYNNPKLSYVRPMLGNSVQGRDKNALKRFLRKEYPACTTLLKCIIFGQVFFSKSLWTRCYERKGNGNVWCNVPFKTHVFIHAVCLFRIPVLLPSKKLSSI